ncbi:MAG: PAS domain S-box protein [Mangrovibacterium sp.]
MKNNHQSQNRDYKNLTTAQLLAELEQKDATIDVLMESIGKTSNKEKREVYAVTELCNLFSRKMETFAYYHQACDIICLASPFPDFTSCKITLFNKEYLSSDFKIAPLQLQVPIFNNDGEYGSIEVFLHEEFDSKLQSIDLADEMSFLDLLAAEICVYTFSRIFEDSVNSLFQNGIIVSCMLNIDHDFRIQRVNQSFLERTGFKLNEVIGKSPQEIGVVNSDDIQSAFNLIKNGELVNHSVMINFKHKDGSTREMMATIQRLFISGENFALCSFLNNIDLSRFQKELDAKSSILQNIMNNLEDVYLETDSNEKISMINRVGPKLYGYSSVDEMVGLPAINLFANPDDASHVLNKFLNGQNYESRLLARRKDGSSFWVSINGNGVINQKTHKMETRTIIRDISREVEQEEDLRRSNERLNTILYTLNDAYFHIDANNLIIFVNEMAIKLFGYAHGDEMVGELVNNLYYSIDERKELINNLDTEGNLHLHTIRCQRKDGSLFWGKVSVKSSFLEDGSLNYRQILVRDVSQQLKDEQEIKQHNILLKDIFESINYGFFQTNELSRINYLNPKLVSIFGYDSEEEMLGLDIANFYFDPNFRESIITHDSYSSTDYFVDEIITQLIRKDGTVFWGAMSGRVVKDNNGNLIYTRAAIRDISEQVRQTSALDEAKVELEKSRLRFKSLAEQSSEGIALLDEHSNFEFFNHAFCELHDMSYEEMQHVQEVSSINQLGKSNEQIDLVLQTKKTHHFRKMPFSQKDGRIKFANIHGTYLKLPHENLLLFTFTDITEEVHKQEELIEARRKAVEAERVKSAFLMNMSHEIRTPMNGILGFVDLLSYDDVSLEERQSYVKIINQSGERLLSTINDIIEVSRIESGKLEVRCEEINLIEFLSYHYNFFLPQIEAKSLEFQFLVEIAPEESMVICDKKILDGICTNLIKNAIKFTDHGKITFSCSRINEWFKIEVSDTGQGISEQKKLLIFEQFSQADKDYLNRKHEGSGLGLTITKAYVESLSGKITLSSELHKGSTFTVLIPHNKCNES